MAPSFPPDEPLLILQHFPDLDGPSLAPEPQAAFKELLVAKRSGGYVLIVVYGCLWMSVDVYGLMMIDVYGCLWMFMD